VLLFALLVLATRAFALIAPEPKRPA